MRFALFRRNVAVERPKNPYGLLLLQWCRVILTNVCNGCRSSVGAHTSPRKRNLEADPKKTPLRQIHRLAGVPGHDWADSNLDDRGILWRQLFFLMPRSAKLATALSPGADRLNASSADMPWLMQSTSRLDQLSTSPPFEPSRPSGDGAMAKNAPVVVPTSRHTAEMKPRSMPSEPTTAHIVEEPQGQALSVLTGTGEPAPASPPESEAAAAAGPPTPVQASQSDSSRPRHIKKSATNKTPPRHPPLQAIQEVLLKHSRLLK